jgi:uncharacterized protein YneF (UPF0154 family)
VIGTVATLAGEVPDSIDSANAQQVVLGLLALCVVGVFFVLRTIQKAMTRAILLAILLAVGTGLWIQREQLQDCAGQCSCHVFGRDLNVTDAAGVCR